MVKEELDPRRIEVVDGEMARILRSKSGAERLRIAFSMFTSARRMIQNHLESQHPDWTPEEIRREAGKRLSHGAI